MELRATLSPPDCGPHFSHSQDRFRKHSFVLYTQETEAKRSSAEGDPPPTAQPDSALPA